MPSLSPFPTLKVVPWAAMAWATHGHRGLFLSGSRTWAVERAAVGLQSVLAQPLRPLQYSKAHGWVGVDRLLSLGPRASF